MYEIGIVLSRFLYPSAAAEGVEGGGSEGLGEDELFACREGGMPVGGLRLAHHRARDLMNSSCALMTTWRSLGVMLSLVAAWRRRKSMNLVMT